ncbi:MAG: hypothetical protein ACR2IV_16925 [Bryobacteraceae bacterium]
MGTRGVHILTLAYFGCSMLVAADNPFVGTWKLNADESKFTGQQQKIEDLGGNKYKFSFGDDTDTIVADGTDQKTKYGNTWSVKQEGPNSWKSVFKRAGKVTSTSTWTISDDGNMFTSKAEGIRPDGSSFTNEFKAKRISGKSGLAGMWESTELKLSSPSDWEIKPYGSDGLSFTTPAEKEHLDLKFDGKDYADHGPRVAPGSTSSGRRIDERTIELTDKLKGKVMDTNEMKLSEDGKRLTLTVHNAGVEKPQIVVYDKQ